MPHRQRHRANLPLRQRREKIVSILSQGLIHMPQPLQIPPENERENSRQPSKKALTLQAALVHLLIDRVEYDADTESISISYHPTGIRTLAGQHEENATCPTA